MGTEINVKSARAYVEILEIIKNIEPQIAQKIPKSLIEYFEKYKAKNYIYKFDNTKSFDEQLISEETGGILALIVLNYIANDEEKDQIKEKLIENENKYQEELKELYNPENIFKNRQKETKEASEEENVENSLTIIKPIPWYMKIINKIKGLFKKS